MSFTAPPAVRGDVAIFSGTALPEFLRFRLGRDLASPFAGYRFGHPGTRWYNHREPARDACPFPRQRRPDPGLLRRVWSAGELGEGRRPLLIAKKRFAGLCARLLAWTLAEIHPTPVGS